MVQDGQGELVTSSDAIGSPNTTMFAQELQMDYEMPMGDNFESCN